MKRFLIGIVVLAFLTVPAMAVVQNVSVTATIEKYVQIVVTDATIDFGAMNPLATGWVEAVDHASGTIQGNTPIEVAYNNGGNLTSGTNTLETQYCNQLLGGPVSIDGTNWYTFPAGYWSGWDPSANTGIIYLKAGYPYTVGIKAQVMRNGLSDPTGAYASTMILTISTP